MNRRDFIKAAGAVLPFGFAALSAGRGFAGDKDDKGGVNIVLIAADDMSYESPGCMGNDMAGVTPNLDRLASEGLLIENCHITTPICGPSRESLFSGLHPQSHGRMGHGDMPPLWWKNKRNRPGYVSVTKTLRDNGYFTGVIGKHTAHQDRLDFSRTAAGMTAHGRDPSLYYKLTRAFLDKAKKGKKAFFLNVNTHDPHRYWANHPSETPKWIEEKMKNYPGYKRYRNGKPWPDPQKTYKPDEVLLPACLPREPELKKALASYYGSVNRMDQSIGEVLRALKESGQDKNTMVLFLSDHGLGWIFNKWTLYPYGTKTPLIVRWPGKIKPGLVNKESVVSAVDVAPTLLEAAGLTQATRMQGQSFQCLFADKRDKWKREEAFTCFNYMNNSPDADRKFPKYAADLPLKHEHYRPMRALSGERFTYVWNAWSDGKTQMPKEMGIGDAVFSLLRRKKDDPADTAYPDYGRRAAFYEFRVPEELYDTKKDPGCLKNLAGQAEYGETLETFRGRMTDVLKSTQDHELKNYRVFLRKRPRGRA